MLPAFRRPHVAGQSMIELAFFATLILVVLSTLVNFALNADYQQQAMMTSFRNAMRSATMAMAEQGTPSAVSNTIIEDRIIPDPTHPFEIGAASEVSYSSSSPTRTFRLGQSADLEVCATNPVTEEATSVRPREEELSRQTFTFQGGEVDCPSAVRLRRPQVTCPPTRRILLRNAHGCTTEGWRAVHVIFGFVMKDGEIKNAGKFYGEIDKYNEVYGMPAVRPYGDLLFPGLPENYPLGNARHAYIIDPMEGEIINYETGQRLCRLMFDNTICEKSCERGKDPKTDLNCSKLCAVRIREVPWYCNTVGNIPDGTPSPALEAMFRDVQDLGLQPGKTTLRTVNTTRARDESLVSVKTTDTINAWSERSERTVKYSDPTSHTVKEYPGPGTPQVFESKNVTNQTTTWDTPWKK